MTEFAALHATSSLLELRHAAQVAREELCEEQARIAETWRSPETSSADSVEQRLRARVLWLENEIGARESAPH